MEFRIPEPCPEPWEQMQPRPRGRHCARCDRTLIDFTRMTRARAEAVARGLEGAVCGRLAVNVDTGEAWFPPPSKAPRWTGGVVLATALTLGCGTQTRGPAAEVTVEAEPPPEPGPPMQPVDPLATPAPEPERITRAVPVGELALPEDSPLPTAAQRAQTARKRAALAPAPAVPNNVHVYDGFMF